jgi:phage recombination protein Bet
MNALVKHEGQSGMQVATWDKEQRDLIRRTCAPGATDDELAMYLHVAKTSGLDPLRRQLHFVKVQGRVHFIADVNGLQQRAAQEPDFEGLLHAVVYEKDAFEVDEARGEVAKHTHNPFGNNGPIVGAWAQVRRRGMTPFLSIVRFSEYVNANNPLWKTKPAVMVDKVAKSTALRLAFPTQLGGIYDRAELDKVPPEPADAEVVEQPRTKPPSGKRGGVPHPPGSAAHISEENALQAAADEKTRAALDAALVKLGKAPQVNAAAAHASAKALVEKYLGSEPTAAERLYIAMQEAQDVASLEAVGKQVRPQVEAGRVSKPEAKELRVAYDAREAQLKAPREPGAEG